MVKLLISINPIHVQNIEKGIKKFEYRTKTSKLNADVLVIYSTSPVKKIIGEVSVSKIFSSSPDELWKMTKSESGITKEFFDKYFKNRKIAYAYQLKKLTLYEDPLPLSYFGIKHPPQSFCYINK